jgi:predicted dehydrogenase
MIKTAIIGYGYMGEIRRRIVEENPDLSLTLICEPDSSKLTGSYPFQVTRDLNEVYASDADLVFVCTPNHVTSPAVVECLRRNKHVFCEKPPGRNLEDVVAIQRQEELSKGNKLVFGFNHRFHPGIQRARTIINTGRFGEILWLRGVYGKSGGKNFHQSWRNKKEISGGGILLDQGIHMLDLFCYFCDDFPQVKAFTNNKHWNFDVEDNAFVILSNDRKQNAVLHSSATLWRHRFQLEIGLEKGYLTVQGLLSKTGSYGRETLIVGHRQFEDEADAVGNPSEEITYFDRDLSWKMEVDNIVECIKNDKPVTACSSAEAYKVMKIIEKAYRNSVGEDRHGI